MIIIKARRRCRGDLHREPVGGKTFELVRIECGFRTDLPDDAVRAEMDTRARARRAA
jgi:hypothetical protein